MRSKRFFIIRHAERGYGGFLTPQGQMATRSLASTLKKRYDALDSSQTVIATSTDLCPLKTGQTLSMALHPTALGRCRAHPEFISNDRRCDIPPAIVLMRKYAEQFVNVVVITHEEMTNLLPAALAELLGIEGVPADFRTDNLHGIVLDVEKRNWDFIFPIYNRISV